MVNWSELLSWLSATKEEQSLGYELGRFRNLGCRPVSIVMFGFPWSCPKGFSGASIRDTLTLLTIKMGNLWVFVCVFGNGKFEAMSQSLQPSGQTPRLWWVPCMQCRKLEPAWKDTSIWLGLEEYADGTMWSIWYSDRHMETNYAPLMTLGHSHTSFNPIPSGLHASNWACSGSWPWKNYIMDHTLLCYWQFALALLPYVHLAEVLRCWSWAVATICCHQIMSVTWQSLSDVVVYPIRASNMRNMPRHTNTPLFWCPCSLGLYVCVGFYRRRNNYMSPGQWVPHQAEKQWSASAWAPIDSRAQIWTKRIQKMTFNAFQNLSTGSWWGNPQAVYVQTTVYLNTDCQRQLLVTVVRGTGKMDLSTFIQNTGDTHSRFGSCIAYSTTYRQTWWLQCNRILPQRFHTGPPLESP